MRFLKRSSPAQVDREEMKERMLTRVVVYSDKFSENAKSLCDGLLAKEVDKRMGFKDGCCDEIRAHPFFKDINWRKLNAGTISFLLYPVQKCVSAGYTICVSLNKTCSLLLTMFSSHLYFSLQVFCLLLSSQTLKWCTPKVWMMSGHSPL